MLQSYRQVTDSDPRDRRIVAPRGEIRDRKGRLLADSVPSFTVTLDPRKAPDELLTLVYDELRKLAAAKMAAEKAGQTLQPTALVHEAYLRLVEAMFRTTIPAAVPVTELS